MRPEETKTVALPKMEDRMRLSTRNQLKGTVTGVALGGIMAEVRVDIGGQTVVAAITRGSAEELELAEGDTVTVLVKATEVMLGKE
jgi:molybdenum-pterin binding domain